MKKIIITGIILLVIILIIWKLASNKKELNARQTNTDTVAIAIPVRAVAAKTDTIKLNIQKTGNIFPFKEAKVLSTQSGIITKLYFELGSKVSQDKLLAVSDNSAAVIDLQKARMNVAKLSNDLETYRELLEGKATTAQKVKDLQQQYNDAVSQEKAVLRQINDANVLAPISGMILSKDVEAGVFVNAGAQLATIVNTDKVKVQVNLSENEIYRISQGQTVKISASVYPEHEFKGQVTFISPRADDSHNYMVEVTMTNTEKFMLRPGTFVKTDFLGTTSREALVIPREAISGDLNDAAVFLVSNNQVKLKKIKTGQETNGSIEVISGLNQGDVVVVSGQINLKDGSPVSLSK
jgi:membrane fusion protein (multidrug efflux system)